MRHQIDDAIDLRWSPGSTEPARAKVASVYAGYEDFWGTRSGAVTEALSTPRLGRSAGGALQARPGPGCRQRVLEKMRVDAQSGAPVNQAVQNAREIYATSGLVGLRQALKKGTVALPAVLIAVPGLQEMMDQQQPQQGEAPGDLGGDGRLKATGPFSIAL